MSQKEVTFMGRMTARMTHEIKNILAILKESSGLMSDIFSLNRELSFPHRDKMERSLTRIQEQIPRGVELLMQFNRLAHSMDEPESRVEINDLLEHAAALMQCFARLKKVELKTSLADEQLSITTDPFRLIWILCSSIEYVLERAPEEGTINLHSRKGQKHPLVSISYGTDGGGVFVPESCKESHPPELAFLKTALEALKIRILSPDPSEGMILVLEISS